MSQIRAFVLTILEKVSKLLTSEPARAIGYGSAVVLYLTVRLLNELGHVQFGQLTFEESIVATAASITIITGIVESIRRFVYSPLTYIGDLSDEWHEGHERAHFEDEAVLRYQYAAVKALTEAAEDATVPANPPPASNGRVH